MDRRAVLLAFILVVDPSRVDRQPPVEEAVFRAEFERVEHFLTDRPQRRDIGGQRTEGAEAVVEADAFDTAREARRSEEHTSELQSLMRISYAVFCLKKKQYKTITTKRNKNILQKRSIQN